MTCFEIFFVGEWRNKNIKTINIQSPPDASKSILEILELFFQKNPPIEKLVLENFDGEETIDASKFLWLNWNLIEFNQSDALSLYFFEKNKKLKIITNHFMMGFRFKKMQNVKFNYE